jgi:hypothetical protein
MIEVAFFQCLVAAGMYTDWSDKSIVLVLVNKKDFGECDDCFIRQATLVVLDLG